MSEQHTLKGDFEQSQNQLVVNPVWIEITKVLI
jgi:hypothetical protein